MIVGTHIEKTFSSGEKAVTVLRNIDISIMKGEFVAIMGPSGAGKSTLLYQLGLLDTPTAGTITLNAIDTGKLSPGERTRFRLTNLGFVFQDYALLPELSALENVYLTLLMQGLDKQSAILQGSAVLEEIGLGNRFHNLPSQLSGGEQQRVSIARAIAHEPAILFADEPTASLDSERSFEIMQIFENLNKKGQTIVMVTHEPEYAAFAKRIIILKDGVIVSDELQKIK